MTKIYRLLRFKTKFFAFLILFLVAVYVIAGRVALSILPDYKPDLEQYLSENLSHPVTIGKISSKWVGFDPVIAIKDISVNGEDNARVGLISARIATLKSFLNLSPRFKSIQLVDSNLSLEQLDRGAFRFAGIELSSDDSEKKENDGMEQLATIFDGAEIKLHNNHVFFKGMPKAGDAGKTRVWTLPSVSMNYRGDKVYASGKVLQPDGKQALLSFSLEGAGILSEAPVNGTLYLEARSSEFFDEVINVYQWQDVSIQDLDASSRLWLDFSGLSVFEVTGDLQVSEMNWKIAEESLPPFTNIASRFHWFKRGNNQQLTLSGLGFDWAGHSCRSSDVLLNSNEQKTLFYIDQIAVDCLSDLAVASGKLSPTLQQRLEASRPRGMLNNILLVMNQEQADSSSGFSFEAELQQVALESFYSTPMGAGIDGYIGADKNGGSVLFQSNNFELGFPTLFLEPWKTNYAEGGVNWYLDGDDVEVSSNGIRLYFSDGGLVYGDFALWLNPEEREDYLSLTIAMQDLPIERATDFVPYYAVGEGLYNWLDQSLVSGSVSHGIYVGYGSTEGNDVGNDFTSSIQLETDQGKLSFTEGWPEIEELSSSIHLQNGELKIEADHATIHNTALNGFTVELVEKNKAYDSPEEPEPRLRAQAKVEADAKTLDYWLKESPIAPQTRPIAEQIAIEGAIEVDISLDIPVSDAGVLDYNIRSHLDANTITHLDSNLPFEDVTGELLVSSKQGVVARDIHAKLLQQPAKVSITEDLSKDVVVKDFRLYEGGKLLHEEFETGHDVEIDLSTRVSMESFLQHYEIDPLPGVSGEFDIQAALRLPAGEERPPILSLQSDFIGLQRDWPEPLTKNADQSESFWLNLIIKPEQLHLHAGMESVGNPATELDLLFVDKRFIYGDVRIGGAETKNKLSEGLSVSGKLDSLELEPWIDFIQNVEFGKGNGEQGLLQQVELDVSKLHAFGVELDDISSRVSPWNEVWQVDLFGDMAQGQIQLASDDSPLNIDLKKLVVPKSDETADVEKKPLSPLGFPELKFAVEQLVYDGRQLGSWQGHTEPFTDGVYFRELLGKVNSNAISGQLNWNGSEEASQSILTLEVKGGDIAHITDAFGLSEALNSKELNSELGLVWRGTPADFELADLSGSIKLKLEDGILNTSDEKTGFLRVFGIFNAETIMRRLKFDFSDLYKSGLAYDDLSLKASIEHGLLRLEEPLKISGPSGKYQLVGASNLEDQTLDMRMRVELPITQNVPLAALMLGAPQVGGAVWLVDKLLGEPLSSITSASYDVTGTWENPKVELKEAGRKDK